jgi:glycosyltransferase involved in cell wall biosynthesis
VHAHDPELIPLCIAYRIAFGAKFVFDAHENLSAQIASKHYLNVVTKPIARLVAGALERLASSQADAIVIAEAELGPIFAKNRNVTVVRNFPWLVDRFSAGEDESPSVGPVVGYVGAVAIDRGFRVMQSVAERSKHRPTLRLAGRLQPDSLRAELSNETEYVGPIEPSTIPEFLASLDVGLCLLRPEPNYVNAKSTKIYEYMMSGKPFLYSNFPAWVAEHGSQYGLPVDPEDIDDIARQLDILLDSPATRSIMGDLGRAKVEESYSFDAESKQLIGLYEVLQRAPKGARRVT